MNSKNDGQVFTPIHIVDKMLDMCGLVGANLFKYKIIEPSFGEGVFLFRLIERMKEYAKQSDMNFDEFYFFIKNNIYGIEKDFCLHHKVIKELTETIIDCGLSGVDENIIDLSNNIICGNTLEINQFDSTMDIVIGNPPWIKYTNILDNKERELIKSFSFSNNGNTDIYITFFEKGLQMLNDNGLLCFITPNSYFNIKAGAYMREYISTRQMLKSVVDFKHQQIFDGFTTYSCITLLTKQVNTKTCYINKINTKELIVSDYYIGGNFYFDVNDEFAEIINYSGAQTIKVKNGCATLWDDFFIGNKNLQNSVYSKLAIKSSTGKETFCFFPYDDKCNIIDFKVINKIEPTTAQYLEQNKERLLKRDIDKNSVWYAYGRSQAISDTYNDKYIVNTLYSKKEDIRIAKCPANTMVYGGIYVIGNITEIVLRKILCSEMYFEYVKGIGKYKSGGYYTIGSKEVENFINYSLQKMQQN